MARYDACPGSWMASSLCPPSPDTADSAEGTRIHLALATGDTAGLDEDQIETAEMCQTGAHQLVLDWGGSGDDVPAMLHREVRYGLTVLGGVVDVTDATTARMVCTGQADLVVVEAGRAMVIDYKTGRGDYEHASGNAQLRTLASLVARRYRVQSVRVAIVQPWAGPPTVADFDSVALEAAHEWLGGVLARAMRATPANLRAGDWCHWCPAKCAPNGLACPALRDAALATVEPLALSLPSDVKLARQAIFARVLALPAAQHAAQIKGSRIVGWYLDALLAAGKVRAKDDTDFRRFYRLEDGDEVREVIDTGAVFGLLQPHGLTAEALLADCVTIKVGALDTAVQKAGGPNIKKDGAKGSRYAITSKQATEIVTKALQNAGALRMKRNAEKLVEVTGDE